MSDTVPERKMAPVQGWPQGIPWSLHLEAYAAYCKKWSPQPALIDLEGRNCRGGFHTGELDDFIPGWRKRASEIAALRTQLEQSAADSAALREELERERARPSFAVQLERVIRERDDLRERVKVLEGALSLAYGHLWCINNEPGTPSPLRSAMDAAYAARMVLRHLLTTEQRGNGINTVRTELEQKP